MIARMSRPGLRGEDQARSVADRSAKRASARRRRERDIVVATRALFDERGVQDAQMEEIARAVGITKALIYRHFASQEELFVATVNLYLAELDERLAAADDEEADAVTRLRRASEAYLEFCAEYPAFLDCALSLMRHPFAELAERVSQSVLLQLGQAMSSCLSRLSRILAEGVDEGVFAVDEPDLVANQLYAQGIGAMHLARVRAGVAELAPGVPRIFEVEVREVIETAVDTVLAYATAPPR
jgi:AcrR family transcriptional regulator